MKDAKEVVIQMLADDNTYEILRGSVEDGQFKIDNEAALRGPTLACWIGIHAYANGVCLNCGKKR